MADSGGILKLVLLAGGGYLAYRWISESATPPAPLSPTPGAAPAGTGGGSPASTPAPIPPPVTAYNSLDAIGQRIAAAVGSTPYTADQFNVFLSQQLPAGKGAPDPAGVFTQDGWDRTAAMTFANWWGVMAPYLRSNLGLSGFGVLHGLGVYIASRQAGY